MIDRLVPAGLYTKSSLSQKSGTGDIRQRAVREIAAAIERAYVATTTRRFGSSFRRARRDEGIIIRYIGDASPASPSRTRAPRGNARIRVNN